MPGTLESLSYPSLQTHLGSSDTSETVLAGAARRDFFSPSSLASEAIAHRSEPSLCTPLVFLNCKSGIAATIERMETGKRGVVVVPITQIPGGLGRFAVVQDIEGNHIGLQELGEASEAVLRP